MLQVTPSPHLRQNKYKSIKKTTITDRANTIPIAALKIENNSLPDLYAERADRWYWMGHTL